MACPPELFPTLDALAGAWSQPVALWYDLALKDSLFATSLLMMFFAVACFVLSSATGNSSYVDRLWSISPAIFAWVFAAESGIGANRPTLQAILASLWGARLTYNFYRKGGYNLSDEDYRWPYIRQYIPPLPYLILNITFISFYQNALLWLITLPSYVSVRCSAAPLGNVDILIAAAFLVILAAETVADQQQWNFQTEKYRLLAELPASIKGTAAERVAHLPTEYRAGFCYTGVFRYSRHLNFCCEMSIWWAYFAFVYTATSSSVLATPHWSIIGTLLLTLLFQASTLLTEYITKEKYPLYAKYQKTTSRFIPWLPGKRLDAME